MSDLEREAKLLAACERVRVQRELARICSASIERVEGVLQDARRDEKVNGAAYEAARRDLDALLEPAATMASAPPVAQVDGCDEAAASPRPCGHGGTSIQKVEIVITSNQDPSRIARAVQAGLMKLNGNPRSGRFTPLEEA